MRMASLTSSLPRRDSISRRLSPSTNSMTMTCWPTWRSQLTARICTILGCRMGLTMRHPNIVQILAVNCDRQVGQHVIVMEFVEGDNLREMLSRRGKLEVKEAIRIGEEAAAGLSYAYS